MSTVVVDTSAVLAVVQSEPGADRVVDALEQAGRRVMSAATLVEVSIVIEARFGASGRWIVDRFLRDAEIDVVTIDRRIADQCVDGWRRYGKGRHPAGLNLGDCFAYGLAVDAGAPVVCTGRDFAQTDVPTLGSTT